MSYPVAVRIPAGRTDALRQLFAESLGPRRAEYDDLQRRSGITDEAYWLQFDDDGDSLIVLSNRDQAKFMEIMNNPQTDFDRWFRDRMQEIFAFDLTGPPPPSNELIGRWSA
jgi:hypothetical protein